MPAKNPRPQKPAKTEQQMRFGAWLKAKRDEHSLTGAEAAKRAGVDPTTWRALEAPGMPWHAPSPKTIRGIATTFDTPEDEVAARAGVVLPTVEGYPQVTAANGTSPEVLQMMGRLIEQLAEAQRQNAELLNRLADAELSPPRRRRGRPESSG